MSDVIPFTIGVSDADLRDLHERLRRARWPEAETVSDWSQGVPLAYLKELCDYWAKTYDWRATEARLNELPQFRTEIDGLGIHFVHVRSPHATALPLVITNGWPGSMAEYLKVIGPLTDPVAHGGNAADAFHVVIPSIPGYGFSDKPARGGADGPRRPGKRPGMGVRILRPAVDPAPDARIRPRRLAGGPLRVDRREVPSVDRLRCWSEPERGGHFAALEQPALFVDEVRSFFRLAR
jgi:hypothetical protein